MGNTPAFQFYPADLIADTEVMLWDMETLGAYWQMLNYLWLNSGVIDTKLQSFPEITRTLFRKRNQKSADKLWKKIEVKFEFKDGVISHKRIDKEMQKQAVNRLRRQQAGKMGGDAKAENRSNAMSEVRPPATIPRSTSSSTSTTAILYNTHTADDFKEVANLVGCTDEDAVDCYNHLSSQNWLWGNGQPVGDDPRAIMMRWKKQGQKINRYDKHQRDLSIEGL